MEIHDRGRVYRRVLWGGGGNGQAVRLWILISWKLHPGWLKRRDELMTRRNLRRSRSMQFDVEDQVVR